MTTHSRTLLEKTANLFHACSKNTKIPASLSTLWLLESVRRDRNSSSFSIYNSICIFSIRNTSVYGMSPITLFLIFLRYQLKIHDYCLYCWIIGNFYGFCLKLISYWSVHCDLAWRDSKKLIQIFFLRVVSLVSNILFFWNF